MKKLRDGCIELVSEAVARLSKPIPEALCEEHRIALDNFFSLTKNPERLRVLLDIEPVCLPTECGADVAELLSWKLYNQCADEGDGGPNRHLSDFSVVCNNIIESNPSAWTLQRWEDTLASGKQLTCSGLATGLHHGKLVPGAAVPVSFQVRDVMETPTGNVWSGIWVQSALYRCWYRVKNTSKQNRAKAQNIVDLDKGPFGSQYPGWKKCWEPAANTALLGEGERIVEQDLIDELANILDTTAQKYAGPTASEGIWTFDRYAALRGLLSEEALLWAAPHAVSNSTLFAEYAVTEPGEHEVLNFEVAAIKERDESYFKGTVLVGQQVRFACFAIARSDLRGLRAWKLYPAHSQDVCFILPEPPMSDELPPEEEHGKEAPGGTIKAAEELADKLGEAAPGGPKQVRTDHPTDRVEGDGLRDITETAAHNHKRRRTNVEQEDDKPAGGNGASGKGTGAAPEAKKPFRKERKSADLFATTLPETAAALEDEEDEESSEEYTVTSDSDSDTETPSLVNSGDDSDDSDDAPGYGGARRSTGNRNNNNNKSTNKKNSHHRNGRGGDERGQNGGKDGKNSRTCPVGSSKEQDQLQLLRLHVLEKDNEGSPSPAQMQGKVVRGRSSSPSADLLLNISQLLPDHEGSLARQETDPKCSQASLNLMTQRFITQPPITGNEPSSFFEATPPKDTKEGPSTPPTPNQKEAPTAGEPGLKGVNGGDATDESSEQLIEFGDSEADDDMTGLIPRSSNILARQALLDTLRQKNDARQRRRKRSVAKSAEQSSGDEARNATGTLTRLKDGKSKPARMSGFAQQESASESSDAGFRPSVLRSQGNGSSASPQSRQKESKSVTGDLSSSSSRVGMKQRGRPKKVVCVQSKPAHIKTKQAKTRQADASDSTESTSPVMKRATKKPGGKKSKPVVKDSSHLSDSDATPTVGKKAKRGRPPAKKSNEPASDSSESSEADDENLRPPQGKKKVRGPKRKRTPSSSSASSDTSSTPEEDQPPPKQASSQKRKRAQANGTASSQEESDSEGTTKAQPAKKPARKGTNKSAPANASPFTKPQDMFKDMAATLESKYPGLIKEKLDAIDAASQQHKLRVATMCSGTESPVLALRMFETAFGRQFFTHVFSCEIEPFKQAYIERNFSPPYLFRDIRELDQTFASTAYGGQVRVPRDIDVLVAGTVCKDFSSINNHRKGLDDKGQSGETFSGMLNWVRSAKPTVVVLENVRNAPWDKIVDAFEQLDVGKQKKYAARHLKLDTKKFYLPHTRERGYLCAVLVDKKEESSSVLNPWQSMVEALRRPTGARLEEFMLPLGSPILQQFKKKTGGPRAMRKVGWQRCELRHATERVNHGLGQYRPLTQWDETGAVNPPDYAWTPWIAKQSDRVKDAIDIHYLRSALHHGFDSNFKCCVWNLACNVDRGSTKLGVCPCLTPTMIPFLTTRGGPIVGTEGLALQGIPTEGLILTRENQRQLADLAGNAMSTTVVGACIMSAILTVLKLKTRGGKSRKSDDPELAGEQRTLLPEDVTKRSDSVVKWKWCPVDMEQARLTATLCDGCEVSGVVTSACLHQCVDCKHTSCSNCKGNPKHSFKPFDHPPRPSPQTFGSSLNRAVPSCIRFDLSLALPTPAKKRQLLTPAQPGICFSSLAAKRTANGKEKGLPAQAALTKHDLQSAGDTIKSIASTPFRFVNLARKRGWLAQYRSEDGRWRVEFDLKHWAVIDTRPPLSACTLLRRTPVLRIGVKHPTAEVDPEHTFLRLDAPLQFEFALRSEAFTPSWLETLGVSAEDQPKIPKTLHISHKDAKKQPGPSILRSPELAALCGTYDHLPRCNGACAMLFKKRVKSGERDVFFFLDPTPTGSVDKDVWVFAHECRRLAWDETREIICASEEGFRLNGEKEQVLRCSCVREVAVGAEAVRTFVDEKTALFTAPPARLALKQCNQGSIMLKTAFDFALARKVEWTPCCPEDLAWSLGSLAIPSEYEQWSALLCEHPQAWAQCRTCTPKQPTVIFKQGTITEDGKEAAVYEQALKHRPRALFAEKRQVPLKERKNRGQTEVRIGVNPVTLLHRASANLLSWRDTVGTAAEKLARPSPPTSKAAKKKPQHQNCGNNVFDGAQAHWRVVKEAAADSESTRQLLSNRTDRPATTPPVMKKRGYTLRPEQLRSLRWMIDRETDKTMFVEEAYEESMLLDWVLEAKVSLPVIRRGGLLADEVGYGKTVLTLALVETTGEKTLVVVPSHLVMQWKGEVQKFLGDKKKVLSVVNAANYHKLSDKEVQAADIVIVSSAVLTNRFSSKDKSPNARRFQAEYAEALTEKESAGLLLEKFAWGRLVVDEFQYLTDEQAYVVSSLSAERRWLLSGTPNLREFNDVARAARLLGVYIGPEVMDSGKRSLSDVERFHTMNRVASDNFAARCEEKADEFLRMFVRQNIAELDELPLEETQCRINLGHVHRVVYQELETILTGHDSKEALEALVRAASVLLDDESKLVTADVSHSTVLQARKAQLSSNLEKLESALSEAKGLLSAIRLQTKDLEYEGKLTGWQGGAIAEDPDAKMLIETCIERVDDDLKNAQKKPPKKRRKKADESNDDGDGHAVGGGGELLMKHNLNESTHTLRGIAREVVASVRSVRLLKRAVELRGKTICCDICAAKTTVGQSSVSSVCGHAGHSSHFAEAIDKNTTCPVKGCSAVVRRTNLLSKTQLASGAEREVTKLEKFVLLTKKILKEARDERIVVFCNEGDLFDMVVQTLHLHSIDASVVTGSAAERASSINNFGESTQVLVIPLGEPSSGLNLTRARNIVFFHPVLAFSAEKYADIERQAIGRCHRYGQLKTVRVYRLLVEATVDTKLFDAYRFDVVAERASAKKAAKQ